MMLLLLLLLGVEPAVRNADVRGLQVGKATTLTLDGDDLGPSPRLLLPFPVRQVLRPGATAKRATFDVTLDASVTPGFYHLRVVSDGGVSAPIPIAVDALPQRPLAAKVEALPAALHGSLTGPAVLATQFTGRGGETVHVEVEAQRLGSRLRPTVHLYDARRRQLAWAWATPTVGGDARLTATLPADGEYTVTLHDAEYAGPSPGHFRLKIGRWSFADGVFPPIIGKGHTRVELLGISPVMVDLPATRPAVVPLPWPKAGVWSGPRPFVTVSDREEVVAKGDGKVQDLPEGAVGVSGRLRDGFAEDRYRVAVKPGTRVRLEAFAERLGSPLHAALVVRDDKGAQLARADESPTTLDPGLDYAVPPKVTSIVVGVLDTQGRPGIYRLTVTPGGSAEKADFRLVTPMNRVILPDGGRCVLPVLVERRGYMGPVELTATLPGGVKRDGTTIPPGADGALVTVQRIGAFDAAVTQWLGRGAGNQERPVVIADAPLAGVQPWAASEVALAPSNTKAAAFAIDWRSLPADVGIVPARKLALPIKVTASTTPVRLTLLTSQNPPRQNNQPDPNRTIRLERPTEVAAKATDSEVPVLVPPELPSPSYDVAVQAELLSPDRRTVLATAYTPVRRLTVRQPLIVTVAPRVEGRAGAAVEIKGKVERREGLAGDVTLTLTGVPGVNVAPVNVKAGAADFAFKLTLPPATPAGDLKGLKIVGTAVADPKQPAVRVRSRDVDLTLAVMAAGGKP